MYVIGKREDFLKSCKNILFIFSWFYFIEKYYVEILGKVWVVSSKKLRGLDKVVIEFWKFKFQITTI